MKFITFALIFTSCAIAKDPKVYEEVLELTEEVIKDELATDIKDFEEADQIPSSSPQTIIRRPFKRKSSSTIC